MTYTTLINFDFRCQYTKYTDGNINFNFPDTGCVNDIGEIIVEHGSEIQPFQLFNQEDYWAYNGSTLDIDLQFEGFLVKGNSYHGSGVSFQLSPQLGLSHTFYHGSSVNATIKYSTYNYIYPTILNGSSLTTDLITYPHFQPSEFISGSTLTSDIEYKPQLGMVSNIESGEYVSLTLANTGFIDMKSIMWAGQQVVGGKISTIPAIQMPKANIYADNKLYLDIITEKTFATTFYNGSGTERFMPEMTDDHIIRLQTGQQVDFNFKAEIFLNFRETRDFRHGQKVELTLKDNPPLRINSILEHGHNIEGALKIIPWANIEPYPIKAGAWFDPAIDPAWLHFSLCSSCHRPPYINNRFIIRLERYDDIRTPWSAEIETKTDFDIQTNQRMDIVSYNGQVLDFTLFKYMEDYTDDFVMYSGHNFNITDIKVEKNLDTEEDDTDYEGDVDIEIGVEDEEPAKYTQFRHGSMSIKNILQANIWTMKAEWRDGAECLLNLTTDEPIEAKLNFCSYLCSDLKAGDIFKLKDIPHGGFCSFAFKTSQEWLFAHGAEFWSSTLKIEYDVEWVDTGCLENEWSDDGINVHHFAVEEEYFRHSLQARCF